jgi:hypothetical protein
MGGQLQIVMRRPERLFELLPFLMCIFLLGFINTLGGAKFNNSVVAIIELLFCLCVMLFFRVPERLLYKAFVMLGLLAALLTLSNGAAAYQEIGYADWRRVYQMLAHGAFLAAVACVFAGWRNAPYHAAVVFAVGAFAYFCIWLGAWYGLEDPFNYPWFNSPPLFLHIRHLGFFLAATSVVLAWAVLRYPGSSRMLFLVALFISLSLLFWTGSRGSSISMLAAVAFVALKFRGWKLLLLPAAVVSALWFSCHFEVAQASLGWLSALQRSGDAGSLNELSSNRGTIWMFLLPHMIERPLLGWGGEGFRALWTGFPVSQAENGFFQLMIEWGGLVTLLVFGVLARILWKAMRQYLSGCAEDGLVLGLGLALCMGILSLTDGVFYHGTPMAYLMLGIGICLSSLWAETPARVSS